MARWKFLLSVIELLFLPLTVEALQGKMCQKSLPSGGVGHLEPKFQGKGRLPANILTPLERQLIALQLYNFAADIFYTMKLCSRLFVLYCRNCPKEDKFRYFIPILRIIPKNSRTFHNLWQPQVTTNSQFMVERVSTIPIQHTTVILKLVFPSQSIKLVLITYSQ